MTTNTVRMARPVQSDLEVVAFTEFGEKFAMAIMGDVKDDYVPPIIPETKIDLKD
ncbi:hypothetical protein J2R80_003222 [Bradyrhizobium sp. USDA 4541]|nr:hypothetical protein [Bradyrhizobium sp. USDA 4541]